MSKTDLEDDKNYGESNGYLAKHGEKLIDNGYQIVPIIPGEKQPIEKGWQKFKADKKMLKSWLSNGYRRAGGVGIITRNTPAIDIDVRDQEVADQVEAFVREMIGDGPLRVGRAPKRLMVFRTDTPFSKMTSKKYRDFEGDLHQIEILCDGQQFVAYHIHPDTKAPYYWPDNPGPVGTEYDDLPTLSKHEAEKVIEFFELTASQQPGWQVASRGRRRASDFGEEDDGLFGNLKTTITLEEIRDDLREIYDYDNRDTWVAIGMALHFEYDASEEAYDAWVEWSENGAKFDERDQRKRWEGFAKEVEKPGKVMLGAAFIKDLRNKEVASRAAEEVPRLKNGIFNATTEAEWENAIAEIAKSELGPIQRENLVALAKKKIDRLVEGGIPIAVVRKAAAFQTQRDDSLPKWLQGWVYDTENDEFFNTDSKMVLSRSGFGAMYDHKAFTKKDKIDGKTTPSATAEELALNIHVIDKVHGRRYGPGEPPIFEEDGIRRGNTYSENMIPVAPDIITSRDKANIRRVRDHITHLLPDEAEQHMLLDWISWVVQHPGQKVRYAVLLQGTQGDGKSFFAFMIRQVMGHQNVRFLSASQLETNFNGWGVGQCVTCIEEVRLLNENRFTVINKMKDLVTNPIVDITFKGKETKPMANTTNYMLFTNYQDAAPIEDNDRRYLILFSQWQSRDALAEFMQKHPRYYDRLYAAIEESPGAIREWLLEYEQSENFNHVGQAPETNAREMMIDNARPQFIRDVREVIEQGNIPTVSNAIIHLEDLIGALMMGNHEVPNEKSASSMLAKHGFVNLGRHFYKGKRHVFFSRRPELFRFAKSVTTSSSMVREYLESLPEKKNSTPLDDEM